MLIVNELKTFRGTTVTFALPPIKVGYLIYYHSSVLTWMDTGTCIYICPVLFAPNNICRKQRSRKGVI